MPSRVQAPPLAQTSPSDACDESQVNVFPLMEQPFGPPQVRLRASLPAVQVSSDLPSSEQTLRSSLSQGSPTRGRPSQCTPWLTVQPAGPRHSVRWKALPSQTTSVRPSQSRLSRWQLAPSAPTPVARQPPVIIMFSLLRAASKVWLHTAQ